MDILSNHYRQAIESDLENLKNIAKRIITTNYAPFLGTTATADFIESGMSDKEIEDGINNCTLMIYGGQIIGFSIINENILHLIMIDVPFQNSGYGSALLKHMEEKLFSSYDKIYLQTFQENVSTVQFYLKNSWVITSQEKVPDLDKIMLQFEKVDVVI